MATSSFFANVKIDDQKTVEDFANALEASANDSKIEPSVPIGSTITNLDEICKFMSNSTKKRNV